MTRSRPNLARMRPLALAAALALALAAAGCGGSEESTSSTTTEVDEPAPAPAETTTAEEPPEGGDEDTVDLYYTAGEQFRKVERTLPGGGSQLEQVTEELLRGPRPGDADGADIALRSQIPDGVRLEDVSEGDGGTVTVELSDEFGDGLGAAAATAERRSGRGARRPARPAHLHADPARRSRVGEGARRRAAGRAGRRARRLRQARQGTAAGREPAGGEEPGHARRPAAAREAAVPAA